MPVEAPANVTRVLHFRDVRPPQEIQFQLERDVVVLFEPLRTEAPMEFAALVKDGTAVFRLRLSFTAALRWTNCYSLSVDGECSGGWFDFWTRDFKPAAPPAPGEDSTDRYQALARAWLSAEAHLTSVGAVQQAILVALRKGATYSTAHKEGGTTIRHQRGRFVRTDYGDSTGSMTFSGEEEFLAFLRQFYDWQTSQRVWPSRVPELDAWKLMLRFLEPGTLSRSGTLPKGIWWALSAALKRW